MKKNHRHTDSKVLYLYGRHPVTAALKNPRRGKIRLLAVKGSEDVKDLAP